MNISRKKFYELVTEISGSVIESLSPTLQEAARHVLIITEDLPPDRPEDELFGLYDGIPLPERGIDNQPLVPDRIFIYRIPLTRMCTAMPHLRREIRATIIHELGHYFGFDEDELVRMGLD